MSAYTELRKQALDKRNKAIALAKADYEQRLIQIAKLERELTGNYRRYRKVTACVEQVIPSDREFSTQDVMVALEALDDTRTWRKDGVDKHLCKLRKLGLIRRVRKPRNNEPAIYVRTGVAPKSRAFEDMTLVEVIASVLKDGPMNATEITVKLLESGYDSVQDRRKLRMNIGNVLRTESDRFLNDGQKWGVIDR